METVPGEVILDTEVDSAPPTPWALRAVHARADEGGSCYFSKLPTLGCDYLLGDDGQDCLLRILLQGTFWNKSLRPALCLPIALTYLPTVDSYKSLTYDFCVAHSTSSLIIPGRYGAIYLE